MICEFCESMSGLASYEAAPDLEAMACETCRVQLTDKALDPAHWQCLTTSLWSENPAVQVTAHRVLTALKAQAFASEALDMLYLEPELLAIAQSQDLSREITTATLDSNGTALAAGDTVTLIKDLPVKGAGFTAKRGTVVRGISLTDNPLHVEGRVEGQRIVLVAAFLKKS